MAKKQQFSIRLDADLIKELDRVAADTDRTRASIITHLLRKGLREYNNYVLFSERAKESK